MMEPVKQVPSRGTNLQQAFNSAATAAPVEGPAVQVDLGTVSWLQYGGKQPTALRAVQLTRVTVRFDDRSCMFVTCMRFVRESQMSIVHVHNSQFDSAKRFGHCLA